MPSNSTAQISLDLPHFSKKVGRMRFFPLTHVLMGDPHRPRAIFSVNVFRLSRTDWRRKRGRSGLLGAAAHSAAKDPVEVRETVEPALETNLRDGFVGFSEKTFRLLYAPGLDIGGEGHSRFLVKYMGEMRDRNAGGGGPPHAHPSTKFD